MERPENRRNQTVAEHHPPLVLSSEHLIKPTSPSADADAARLSATHAVSPAAAASQTELREMIRAVLREELAGPTGERVTENIKKLIRRELRDMLKNGEIG